MMAALSPSVASTFISPPSGVNLTALDSKLTNTCFTLRSSPVKSPRAVVDDPIEFDAMPASALTNKQYSVLDRVRHMKRRHLQLHPSCLDFGKIQDVINQ